MQRRPNMTRFLTRETGLAARTGGATPLPPSSATQPEAGAAPHHPGLGLSEILALVREDLTRVEREFDHHLGSDVEIIETVGRYIAEGGGKRIRPALFLLC